DDYVAELAERAELGTDPAPAAAPPEVPESAGQKWLRWGVALGLLLALGTLIFWIVGQEPSVATVRATVKILPYELSKPTNPVGFEKETIRAPQKPRFQSWRAGEILALFNGTEGELTAADSAGFVWRLYAGDTLLAEQPRFHFTAPEPLRRAQNLRVELDGSHLQVPDSVATYSLRVQCANPPNLNGRLPQVRSVQRGKQLSLDVRDPEPDVTYTWRFSDDTITWARPQVQRTFTEAGNVTATLTAVRGGDSLYCTNSLSFNLNVYSDLPLLPYLRLSKGQAATVSQVSWPAYLLLGGLALLGLGGYYRYRRNRRRERERVREAVVAAAQPPPSPDAGPYTIPYRSRAGQISVPPAFYRLADDLRGREAAARSVFDAPATVAATVTTGGFPSWRERPLQRPSRYLVLTRLTDEAHQQDRLFRRLVDFLREREANLTVYHHTGDFLHFWNDDHPDGWTRTQLATRYGDHRLIIVGNGHALVDPHGSRAPRLRPRAARWLRRWEHRLILTPEPVADWSFPERLLLAEAMLYPVTTAGMRAGVRELRETEEYLPSAYRRYREQTLASFPEPAYRAYRWDTVADHEAYLGHDPELLRWSRALAVCSLPDWDLTIAIGKALGVAVTHDRLLQLSRIPWLAENFPDPELRLALLATVPAADERLARTAVLAELEAVRREVADSFVAAEYAANEVVHLFCLDPHDPAVLLRLTALRDAQLFSGDQLTELDVTAARAAGTQQAPTAADATPNLTAWLATPEPKRLFSWGAVGYLLLLLLTALGLWGLRTLGANYPPAPDAPTPWWQTAEPLTDAAIQLNNRAVGLWEWVDSSELTVPHAVVADSLVLADSLFAVLERTYGSTYEPARVNPLAFVYNAWAYRHNRYHRGELAYGQIGIDYNDPTFQGSLDSVKANYGSDDPMIDHYTHLYGHFMWDQYRFLRDSTLELYPELDSLNRDTVFAQARNLMQQVENRTEGTYYQELESGGYYRHLRALIQEELLLRQQVDPVPDEEVAVIGEEVLPPPRPLFFQTDSLLDAFNDTEYRKAFITTLPAGELVRATNQLARLIAQPQAEGAFTIDANLLATNYIWESEGSDQGVFLYRGDDFGSEERFNRVASIKQHAVIIGVDMDKYPGLLGAGANLEQTLRVRGFTTTYLRDPDAATLAEELAYIEERISLPEQEFLIVWLGFPQEEPTTLGASQVPAEDVKNFTNAMENASHAQVIGLLIKAEEEEETTGVQRTVTLENFDLAYYRDLPVRFPELVEVPGGEFVMGSDDPDARDNETPHRVRLSTFQIAKYEVTAEDYLRFAAENPEHLPQWLEEGSDTHIRTGSYDYYKRYGDELLGRHPIVGVSWYDAVAYVNWLSVQRGWRPAYSGTGKNIRLDTTANGYRLPTEAQWEYAARSGGRDDQKWAGTNQEEELWRYANYYNEKDGFAFTAPVGSLRANPLGLYDMSGNVYEWCWDWYADYPTEEELIDPLGPEAGTDRVRRGGSWRSNARYCRPTYRNINRPSYRDGPIGFRVAWSP
ncbi:MAG: SUMF1/EgtB/PvdO family nonheme iron enzyme, partial [Bacteroidota bacterium]